MVELLRASFEHTPLGAFARDDVERCFGPLLEVEGLERVRVVPHQAAPSGRALAVRYPKGAVGPRLGGAQWRVRLPEAHSELFLAYSLCFEAGFDFVKGGKLPGLVGGRANTGGHPPTGYDGFSARMMWRSGGRAVQYVYHPDQASIWGDDLDYRTTEAIRFLPGVWHRIQHRITLNTPGEPGLKDGLVQAWFDGQLCLDRSGVRFRHQESISIDQLYFSTFFGGNEADWAPTRDEAIYFDDFCVSTARIPRY